MKASLLTLQTVVSNIPKNFLPQLHFLFRKHLVMCLYNLCAFLFLNIRLHQQKCFTVYPSADNKFSLEEYRASIAEPSDVKSPVSQRPSKRASTPTSRQQSGFHLPQSSEEASGAGCRPAASPLALTWDFFSPTRVGSNMMTQLSAQHRHFNDLKARLSPRSTPNVANHRRDLSKASQHAPVTNST